jgi:hypothetical protein
VINGVTQYLDMKLLDLNIDVVSLKP